MEVSALKTTPPATALRGPSPLLRLQSDERLIALTRRGQHAAFETLFSRYHSRLLSFCRHMLGSREDAEDVLQEVFAAAFNAVLADERAINVRPWLYRIARNRSLNHLRRASAIGVDSMDIHFADHGLSTGDQVMRRESFRQLMGDVQQLPETQRTALLLREIDALSYDQIALAMETTVPSVKSLLVRARISLAEASEARKLSCDDVRCELGEVAEGLLKITPPARRHLRDCERCRNFRKHLKDNNHALAAILPVTPLLLLKRFVLTKFGASAGAGHVAGAGGATPPPVSPRAPEQPVAQAPPAASSPPAPAPSPPRPPPRSPPPRSSPPAPSPPTTPPRPARHHFHRQRRQLLRAPPRRSSSAPPPSRSPPAHPPPPAPPSPRASTPDASRQPSPAAPRPRTEPAPPHRPRRRRRPPAKSAVAPKPPTTTPAVVEVTTETTQLAHHHRAATPPPAATAPAPAHHSHHQHHSRRRTRHQDPHRPRPRPPPKLPNPAPNGPPKRRPAHRPPTPAAPTEEPVLHGGTSAGQ